MEADTDPTLSEPSGLSPLEQARQLAATLDAKKHALTALSSSISAQMEALRTHESHDVRETTMSANEHLHVVTRLHEEQAALMAGLAATLSIDDERPSLSRMARHLEALEGGQETAQSLARDAEAIRQLATDTRSKSEELAYSLQYALHLGKELIQAVQAVNQPDAVSLYTPHGKTSIGASPRPFVNRMG